MLKNKKNMINIWVGLCAFFTSLPLLAIEDVAYLPSSYWASASEKDGIQVYDDNLQLVAQKIGQYEAIDAKAISNKKSLVIGINKANNSLDIFEFNEQKLLLIKQIVEPVFSLESACLSYSQENSIIYAFLIKAEQNVEQKIIYNADEKKAYDLNVRQLPISHGISSCRANDKNAVVYFNEENIGVWAFNVDPEAEVDRKPIAMQKPFGKISENNKLVRHVESNVIALGFDESKKILISVNDVQEKSQQITLNNIDEAFDVKVINENQLKVVYANKNNQLSKSVIDTQFKLSLNHANQTKKNNFIQTISPMVETTPVKRFGDAADDPAIWVNKANPKKSLILGTDKKSGLGIYALSGELKQFIATGRVNNVDLRYNFKFNGQKVAIAAASNRDNNTISLYKINADGLVESLNDISTGLNEVYGLCMYQNNIANETYVIINDKDGRFEQYQLASNKNTVTAQLVAQFKVVDQPEGCVANDNTGDLFVGVEDHGIWLTKANDKGEKKLKQIASVGNILVDDVEGLGLYIKADKQYLLASSQGNNSYVVFNARDPYNYLGRFKINANLAKGIDGASETDGLAVSSANFGGEFSEGILVVQDGRNIMPKQPQNFKLVSFAPIIQLILNSNKPQQ